MKDWYSYADEQTKRLNRVYMRLFNNLRQIDNFDELNVIPRVEEVYTKAVAQAKRAYQNIALYIYLLAYAYAEEKRRKQYTQPTEADWQQAAKDLSLFLDKNGGTVTGSRWNEALKVITDLWMQNFLNKPNPVTGYVFDKEIERKKERLIEALAASPTPQKEIDRALRYWTLQSTQYADDITQAAMLEGYRQSFEKAKLLENSALPPALTQPKEPLLLPPAQQDFKPPYTLQRIPYPAQTQNPLPLPPSTAQKQPVPAQTSQTNPPVSQPGNTSPQPPRTGQFVRWITERDEKVCLTCKDRHGIIYPIDKVPPKPHYRCRCWLEPVAMPDEVVSMIESDKPQNRSRFGFPVDPTEKTFDMSLSKKIYAEKIAQKYGINLRGSGKTISIEVDESVVQYGKTRGNNPTVIVLGQMAFLSEEELANTIAHELNHCRSFLRGEGAPESTAYAAGDALAEYIRGNR